MSRAAAAIEYDSRLVEEAVLLELRDRPGDGFWREREEVYAVPDLEERDRRFGELCRGRFQALGLGRPVEEALREEPLMAAVRLVRVAPAASARDEGAELFVLADRARDAMPPEERRSAAGVKLRPSSFLRPEALLIFLRHEVRHLADMLDPGFGYDPAVPEVEGDPLRLKLVLNRYRVLWDTAIDGRLWRAGRAAPGSRELREREFAQAFPVLGERGPQEFARWFEGERPSHRALLEYALDPAARAGIADRGLASRGTCPLCRCPGDLLRGEGALGGVPLEEVQGDFPAWSPAGGLCAQCGDLYRARRLSREAARQLPCGER